MTRSIAQRRLVGWLATGLAGLIVSLLMALSSRKVIWAQTAGAITGTVTDPREAVVPEATVTITNLDTGVVARTTKTGASGVYVAEALPVGTYAIAVEAPGFQRAVRSPIQVSVADRLAIDFTLKVGPTTQTVEVSAAAPLVATQSGEQSYLVPTRNVTELPLLGRNILQLQQLVPGASRTGPDEIGLGLYSLQGFAINGANSDYTGVLMDGVQNNCQGNDATQMASPGPETLAEYKVLTSNYGAKYGTAGGANILAVTKSGTRDFHGSAYEYLRNDKLNAANFFVNKYNRKKAPLRSNDFGYTLGGPLYIPGHYNIDKSKTFFFWSQEWRRQRTPVTILAATPTAAMRKGDFTGFGPLKNPADPKTNLPLTDASGAPCVGGPGMDQINPNCLNHNVGLLFDSKFPLPNAPGFLNFVEPAGSSQNWRNDLIRVDQNVSEKIKVFVRFIHETWVESDPLVAWSGDAFPTIHSTFNTPSHSFIAKYTHIISPTLLNEVSFARSAFYGSPHPPSMEIVGGDLPQGYNAQTVFNENDYNLVPDIFFAGGWGGISALWGQWYAHQGWTQVSDDLTKQVGRHSLTAGGTYIFATAPVDSQTSPSSQGQYYFDGSFSGNPIADALLGLPLTYSELQGRRRPNWRFNQVEAYFQDDWKVTRRFTLNLGLRWFYIPHVYERDNKFSMFLQSQYDPSVAPTVTPDGVIVADSGDLLDGIAIAGQQGIPTGIVQNHANTFAPRFGFSWDLFGNAKTAIRGGYGVGYFRIEGNDVQLMVGNPPFSKLATFFTPPFDNPAAGVAAPLRPVSVYGLDPVYDIPTVQNWSFGIQQEISRNLVLSVGYVGSRGTHLDIRRNINQPLPAQGFDFDPRIACTASTPFSCTSRVSTDFVRPFPGFSGITNVTPVGTSIYHSLQVTLQKRLSHGLTFNGAYTWSRAIGLVGVGGMYSAPQDSYNLRAERGPASFDRTQMLVFNYVYELPFFRGLAGVPGGFLKGWELTGIATFQSGLPLTPSFSSATSCLSRSFSSRS